MRLRSKLLLLFGAASVHSIPTPAPVSSSSLSLQEPSADGFNVPTRYESTVLARRLLALARTGVLSTIFPTNISSSSVPHAVSNTPIGLPEYIASCEEPTGNPTLIALGVSTSTKNAAAGSNVSLAISWWDEYVKITHEEPWSTANLPRLSLSGYLEEITDEEVKRNSIAACFTQAHPDSKWWLPGDSHAAHGGKWMRVVVEQVYWIGGFGDRAFIGWFDPDQWRNVTSAEWQSVRLPGE